VSAVAPPRGALILGADYRALGVARSLGRRGVSVWVVAERAEPLATVSRYARHSVRWPVSGERERTRFLRELAVSQDLHGWALVPSADSTAAIVARNYAELAQHYTHTVPPWDVVRWAYDKRLTYELAQRANVPFPQTLRLNGAVDTATLNVRFPAVLKPAIKEGSNALNTAKAWRLENRADLERRYLEACEFLDPELLLVQELIPGGGEGQLSYVALSREGVPLASLTARRTRQYPADFGRASTFVETVECPDVIAPSLHLLHELRYTGLIEIEYKRDPRTGVLNLLDINPRVWGWHTLCARAGVDFPWLLWLTICGKEVPALHASLGVRWLRLTTDTPTAVRELLRGRLRLTEYTRSLRRPRESAIFAWDDPVPGLVELPVLTYVMARRILTGEAV
jgi:predicted ATP-grasp superfamily ATP-dependent carboligase